ncbi:MAG: RagB/SusD family nutrient uptake outer membrane protein [Gemmatimonadaceae bacterium]
MRNIFDRSGAPMRTSLLMATVVMTLLLGGACSDVLKVELPGRIPTDLLDDPSTATTLASSVVADFECAFSNYIASTSILSDQFLGASGNLSAKNWGTKKINEDDTTNEQTSCSGSLGAYTPLQTARFQADDILSRLQNWTDAQATVPLAPLRARVAAIGAYAYTLLGEGFCAMRFNKEKVIHTPAQVLAIAESKFDAALALVNVMANGTAKTELQNLVYAGRARVRLDRGNTTGAAADAALVTPGFEFVVTRSVDADTRWNDAWTTLSEFGHGSVAPQYRNLTVGGQPDPRVEVAAGPDVGKDLPPKAFDGVTDLYVVTNKNFSRADPMRLASYVEAQLIRAEALKGATAVQIINARRTQLQLPQYTGPADDPSILALVLDERNREFFMEGGQRYNDLLRYKIPWKVGNDQNGLPYGSTTCMPLPLNERIAAGG